MGLKTKGTRNLICVCVCFLRISHFWFEKKIMGFLNIVIKSLFLLLRVIGVFHGAIWVIECAAADGPDMIMVEIKRVNI